MQTGRDAAMHTKNFLTNDGGHRHIRESRAKPRVDLQVVPDQERDRHRDVERHLEG